jgi:phage major head subunit gpT-like protein
VIEQLKTIWRRLVSRFHVYSVGYTTKNGIPHHLYSDGTMLPAMAGGAVVTSDFLAGVLTNFRKTFADAFDAARNMASWRDLALEIESKTLTETHNWLGTPPTMVDVTKGDSQMEGLYSFNYSISNNVYRATIEVDRAVFEDDRLGLIAPRIAQLGEEAVRHPGQLILQLPVSNGNAFDSVAYFADTRVIGRSANIDNNLAQTAITIAGIQTDLALVRQVLRNNQDDQGRPMNNVLNTIMVGPALEQPMFQALTVTFPAAAPTVAQIIPGGGTLTTANGYQVVVNPYITGNNWFGFAVTPNMKPFIFQNRIPPMLEALTNAQPSAAAILSDRFIYSVRARYNVGYGDPRYAVKVA